jgi:hypothetical protein
VIERDWAWPCIRLAAPFRESTGDRKGEPFPIGNAGMFPIGNGVAAGPNCGSGLPFGMVSWTGGMADDLRYWVAATLAPTEMMVTTNAPRMDGVLRIGLAPGTFQRIP